MEQDFIDRRRHPRFEVTQAIFIEVVGKGSRREADNTVIRCETVDVALGGLKIHVPQAIAQGSRLNIAVPFGDWKDNLELTGQAVWCREAANQPGFWVGLQLDDSTREEMERWCQVVYRLSAR